MKQLLRFLLLAVAVLALPVPGWAAGEQRLALVIGNASYKFSPLANPVNDARLMEVALKEAGFTVIKSENASIREMRRLVREFGDRLKASGGVGLFYFAGHGVQVRGENFLVSTDSDIRNEEEVPDDSVNANVVLDRMQSAGNRMNIIILDACRDNPFANKSRSASNGLATLNAPSGSLVAYATAPGSVASDGRGGNGLYTRHLANAIRQSGLPIEEVFKQVRAAVRRDSNNQQTPWENTALEGQFFFRESVALAAPVTPPTTPSTARPTQLDASVVELALWDSVKNSQSAAELQAYLAQYPNGIFSGVARARLDSIKVQPQVQAMTTPTPPRPVAGPPVVASAGGPLGTLVMTETMTGVKRTLAVSAKADGEKTEYSSGDVVTHDGKVLQARLGEAVIKVVSGAMWTIPLVPGQSGQASIERIDVDYKSPGKITWKVTAAGEGKARVDAEFGYIYANGPSSAAFPSYAPGTWFAIFSPAQALPDSTSATSRGNHNRVTTELRTAGIASFESPAKPAVRVASQPVASVQRPVQQVPAVPISGSVIGTLAVTDSLTKVIKRQDVTVIPSDGGNTLYSTGDMVAQDGQVLQVFMGDWVVRIVSGALWTIPVKAGATGEARIAPVQGSGDGSLAWKAVATGDGKLRIEANFFNLLAGVNSSGLTAAMTGLWQATYADSTPLPESFSLRARNVYGTPAATSAEFKLR